MEEKKIIDRDEEDRTDTEKLQTMRRWKIEGRCQDRRKERQDGDRRREQRRQD